MADIVFFTKGGMPTRQEKDYAATLGGTVAFRAEAAASPEWDKAAKYVGYIPAAFVGKGEIIKDFNKNPLPEVEAEPIKSKKKSNED